MKEKNGGNFNEIFYKYNSSENLSESFKFEMSTFTPDPEVLKQFYIGYKNEFEKLFIITKNGYLKADWKRLQAIERFCKNYALIMSSSSVVIGHPNFQKNYLGDIKVTRLQDEMSAADLLPPFSSQTVRKNDQVTKR